MGTKKKSYASAIIGDEYPETMKIRFDEELPVWNYRAIPGKCDN